jgi:hypothetical protein
VADTIIGTHRPALWKAIEDDILEVLVLKQRFAAWPQAVEFDWDPRRCTLRNGRDVEFKHATTERDDFAGIGRKKGKR